MRGGYRVLVVSGDRDTIQLVNDDVTLLYPSKQGVSELTRYDAEKVMERYGVRPEQYPEIAALVGETSDNLPGVPRVGEKTAVKWINQFGSLDEILKRQDEIGGKVGESLRENAHLAVRNRRLNRLFTDVELNVQLEGLKRGDVDMDAVAEKFAELEFRTLLQRVAKLVGAEVPTGSTSPLRAARRCPRRNCSSTKSSETGLRRPTAPPSTSPDWPGRRRWARDQQTPLSRCSGAGRPRLLSVRGVACLRRAEDLLRREGADTHRRGRGRRGLRVSREMRSSPPGCSGPSPQRKRSPRPCSATSARKFRRGTRTSSSQKRAALRRLSSSPGTSCGCTPRSSAVSRVARARSTTEIELPLVPILAQLEARGVAIDLPLFEAHNAELTERVAALEQRAFDAIGHEVNLSSPKQLQQVLFEELDMPKTRKTKSGYTTDAAALADLQQKNPHPFLDSLLAHRDANKLRQIIETLIKAVDPEDQRIHTTLVQVGASTGRLASTDPNLQNIPVRSEEGRRIREGFIHAPEYTTLLTADYSQIEMRIMAHLSGDEGLIEAFNAGEDLHRFVGARIFGVTPAEVTNEMRSKVKAMSYGLAYGLSAFGLSKQLNISAGEAKQLMEDYFERFGGVRDYLRSVVEQAKQDTYTETIFGRRRPFPDLASPNRILRENAERAALNAPIQGSAADIIKIAMIRVEHHMREAGLKSRMLLQIHDELMFEVAEGEQEQLEAIVHADMAGAAELNVPLEVQFGHGPNWNAAAH